MLDIWTSVDAIVYGQLDVLKWAREIIILGVINIYINVL